MATEYTNAGKPVEDVFGTVIAAHHPHLESARWRVVFQDRTMKTRGKEVIGKVQVLTGLTQHLAQLDVVFKISREAWDLQDVKTKEAFIDFLCCQVESIDEGLGFKLRAADFVGMLDNVKRYGAWHFDLRRAKKHLVKQLELPFDNRAKQELDDELEAEIEKQRAEDDEVFEKEEAAA